MTFEQILSLCSVLGVSTIISFFMQRHFAIKDEKARLEIERKTREQAEALKEKEEKEQNREEEFAELKESFELGLETIRLLSYARVAEEADRLIKKGYATPNERAYLQNLYENYKKWKWNGDMAERMSLVHFLPAFPPNETR